MHQACSERGFYRMPRSYSSRLLNCIDLAADLNTRDNQRPQAAGMRQRMRHVRHAAADASRALRRMPYTY